MPLVSGTSSRLQPIPPPPYLARTEHSCQGVVIKMIGHYAVVFGSPTWPRTMLMAGYILSVCLL